MIESLKSMRHFHVHAKDGDIGTMEEFFFEDHYWTIRYVAVEVGHRFHRKKVLLPADSLNHAEDNCLFLDRTREDVGASPDIKSFRHISRSQEIELLDHFNAPYYWNRPQYTPPRVYNPNTGIDFTGQRFPVSQNPSRMSSRDADVADKAARNELREMTIESHMQESKEVAGFTVHAADGDIGHVHDMALDDSDWVIRYLVVDVGGFLSGKKILIAPQWMESVGWEDRRVYTFFDKEKIRNAPEFSGQFPIQREYEDRLYAHYNQPGYWE